MVAGSGEGRFGSFAATTGVRFVAAITTTCWPVSCACSNRLAERVKVVSRLLFQRVKDNVKVSRSRLDWCRSRIEVRKRK